MIDSDVFVQAFQDLGVNFFTGVPDAILGGVIEELLTRRLYRPAVRVDDAVAMAAGAYLGGCVPAVLMQSSGIGDSLTTLVSLNVLYRQPCLLIVAWRGAQGPQDGPEHVALGEALPHLLERMKIPHRVLSEPTLADDLRWAGRTFMAERVPTALLLKKGIVKGLQP